MKKISILLVGLLMSLTSYSLSNSQILMLRKAGLSAYKISSISEENPSDAVVNCTYELSAYIFQNGLAPFAGYEFCSSSTNPSAFVSCVKGEMASYGFSSPTSARRCL